MVGVITALEPSCLAPFSGVSPRAFGKLVTVLPRKGADAVRRGRPWSLPLEDRALLVAASWRTNLITRQLAPLFGVSKSAADRIIDHLGPMPTLQPRERSARDTVLIWEESGVKSAVGKPSWSPTTATQAPTSSSHTVASAARLNSQTGKKSTTDPTSRFGARVEHVFARMKAWRILRDCRLKGDGVHHAMLGIARMHNLALAG